MGSAVVHDMPIKAYASIHQGAVGYKIAIGTGLMGRSSCAFEGFKTTEGWLARRMNQHARTPNYEGVRQAVAIAGTKTYVVKPEPWWRGQ
jgi:hypothetical protein